MQVWEIFVLAIALAMDACAVGMTNGMQERKMRFSRQALIAFCFGFFQFLMPLIGYYLSGAIASAFIQTFSRISSWVSFALLAFLGGKMLVESLRELRERRNPNSVKKPYVFSIPTLLLQSVATSIDALAVGVTLQMATLTPSGLATGAWGATAIIGVVTFILALGAVELGKKIGDKLSEKAGVFGGFVLIAIGLKILLQSLL